MNCHIGNYLELEIGMFAQYPIFFMKLHYESFKYNNCVSMVIAEGESFIYYAHGSKVVYVWFDLISYWMEHEARLQFRDLILNQ